MASNNENLGIAAPREAIPHNVFIVLMAMSLLYKTLITIIMKGSGRVYVFIVDMINYTSPIPYSSNDTLKSIKKIRIQIATINEISFLFVRAIYYFRTKTRIIIINETVTMRFIGIVEALHTDP